tara:strand:+ start:275 stop:760 length:486 start_codon:yes stop_codon:yes gene_type:complete
MKLTTKPISISFKKFRQNEIETIASIESGSSEFPWAKNQLSKSISNPNNLCYAVSVKSQIVGYVIAMLSADSADILNITIHKDFKRKGYGSSLLDYLTKELIEKDIKTIFLEVRRGNFAAISLYSSLGYKEISVRKNYYTKNSNQLSRREDGIIMCLELSN